MVQCFQHLLDSPPPLGSIITVKHNGCYSTGTLKRPVFWREHDGSASLPLVNEVELFFIGIKINKGKSQMECTRFSQGVL